MHLFKEKDSRYPIAQQEKEKMSSNCSAIEKALKCLGRGFDVASDFRLKYCKGNECIVSMKGAKKELFLPGFGTFKDVPVEVKCDKGDRIRFQTDTVEFNQMSELFNQRSNLAGKIPSGLFNAAFDFDGGSWGPDAAMTKCLAMDGYFISLFNLHLECHPLCLAPHVVDAVPATWDPSAVASFIENYGTHVVVGLSMGGQDVVYVKQDKSSQLPLCEIKHNLDKLGDQLFTGICTLPLQQRKSKENKSKVSGAFNVFDTQPTLEGLPPVSYKEGVTVIYSKRGGDPSVSNHCEWVLTVPTLPDAINFSFVPITSLLKGIPGTGFLSHAINLYLRYKPPLSELKYFLDFQHQKIWAPALNDHPLGPSSNRTAETPALYFSPMSPKLHISRSQVTTQTWPVTGMRLYLEGKRNNRVAIHLQHLSHTPKFITVRTDKPLQWRGTDTISDERYYEPVQWKKFAHACTMPVKYDPSWSTDTGMTAFIVTGAQLNVQSYGSTSVLHLRLLYTEVHGYIISQSKWARSPSRFSGKSSFLAMSFTGSSSGLDREKNANQVAHVDSGVFNINPPVPVATVKLLKFVDTSQITMGPQDSPGHWLVTGAKLDVEKGKIMLHVKFSLLTPVS
ncbi:MACPF domain-containing protein [Rhynchospora pubera]|uniref:MACPF domain-containing protein n=1 Tax=Rhynchospora pubera TaxID=906938 RepID=A0AAV8CF00_9POAL|nr:MACPF domain-containing protein [Rhynchospora pubera]